MVVCDHTVLWSISNHRLQIYQRMFPVAFRRCRDLMNWRRCYQHSLKSMRDTLPASVCLIFPGCPALLVLIGQLSAAFQLIQLVESTVDPVGREGPLWFAVQWITAREKKVTKASRRLRTDSTSFVCNFLSDKLWIRSSYKPSVVSNWWANAAFFKVCTSFPC